MTSIQRTTAENKDFRKLVVLLDEFLAKLDGEDHAFYAQFDKLDKINNVVVCYHDDIAIGCGAFKEFDTDTVEIKRMFVHPDFRGKGTASAVLKELELWAGENNYSSCVLETGINNPKAIALYRRSGYEIIPNYGQYENVETSACLKKQL
ncbi:GNAT family N-acetyltransferase [Flavobacterium aquicola]|uniref:Acetyltransferase (GNAT) family protein n=1 Tax=Flavobacterium aquicola TaxID=1682742 RepID=A0A3E0ENU4_9FLAO|nr:GNAT family N-acetyltransferase [Flavobacterium aquicola]REG99755.1 acetyltransferase (GNAT) family protein [Flavobacterium aquicola]